MSVVFRQMMRRIGLLAILWVLLTPLGATPQSTGAQTTGAVLTIGTTEALVNLDPAEASDVFSFELLSHLYTGLTRQKPGTLDYELALAETHTVSADGLTHTFTIRPGAAFDDGTPISARTFADSINRVLNLNGRGAALITPYLKSASVSPEGALVLTLKAPLAYLLQLVALPPYFPVHPAVFTSSSLNRAPAPEKLIGNGPFRVSAFDLGRSLTLAAAPAWKGTLPATARIVLQHFDFSADLREALKAHRVDLAWRGLALDDAENAAQVKGIQLRKVPGLQTFYLIVGQTQEPYNDPVARQGLAYLLERERAVEFGLRNTGAPLYTLLPRELSGAGTPVYPKYDLEQAGTLLAGAGYSRYKRIESEVQSSRTLYGELYSLAADLANSTLSRHEVYRVYRFDTEPRTFLDQIERGTFRLLVVGWTPVAPHPEAYLRPLLASGGTLAAGAHYASPQIDDLLNRAALTSDPAAQTDLYNQAQAIALRDVVALPLWQGGQWLAAWEGVEGILAEPNFLLRYDRLALRDAR